jgi:hypothetical protein
MNPTDIKRWSKISLRTLHLLSIAGVGGGILFGLERELWNNYWWLAIVSGGLMMLMDMVANPVWILQVRGVVIMVKLLLLMLMLDYPEWGSFILILIIVMSGVISHAPGKLRYYSLYHRCVITSENDAKG